MHPVGALVWALATVIAGDGTVWGTVRRRGPPIAMAVSFAPGLFAPTPSPHRITTTPMIPEFGEP
jgi:hypothetical protein